MSGKHWKTERSKSQNLQAALSSGLGPEFTFALLFWEICLLLHCCSGNLHASHDFIQQLWVRALYRFDPFSTPLCIASFCCFG